MNIIYVAGTLRKNKDTFDHGTISFFEVVIKYGEKILDSDWLRRRTFFSYRGQF